MVGIICPPSHDWDRFNVSENFGHTGLPCGYVPGMERGNYPDYVEISDSARCSPKWTKIFFKGAFVTITVFP